jgi:hypothetical protein
MAYMSHTSTKSYWTRRPEAQRHGAARGPRSISREVHRLRQIIEPLTDHVASHEALLHEHDERLRRLEARTKKAGRV